MAAFPWQLWTWTHLAFYNTLPTLLCSPAAVELLAVGAAGLKATLNDNRVRDMHCSLLQVSRLKRGLKGQWHLLPWATPYCEELTTHPYEGEATGGICSMSFICKPSSSTEKAPKSEALEGMTRVLCLSRAFPFLWSFKKFRINANRVTNVQ